LNAKLKVLKREERRSFIDADTEGAGRTPLPTNTWKYMLLLRVLEDGEGRL
jgi:hypothetical protein